MEFFADFWDILLWSFWFFFVFVMIMLMIRVFSDLFVDKSMGGFAKTIWVLFIILLPMVGLLVYVIARGRGMAEREVEKVADMQSMQDKYIQQVASQTTSPAEQIASAKGLLDSGAISPEEFETLKAKALA